MKKLLIIGACLFAASPAFAEEPSRCPNGGISCAREDHSGDASTSTATKTSTWGEAETSTWGEADPIVAGTRPVGISEAQWEAMGGPNNIRGSAGTAPASLGRFDSIPEPPMIKAKPVGAVTFDNNKTTGGSTVVIEHHDDDQH